MQGSEHTTLANWPNQRLQIKINSIASLHAAACELVLLLGQVQVTSHSSVNSIEKINW